MVSTGEQLHTSAASINVVSDSVDINTGKNQCFVYRIEYWLLRSQAAIYSHKTDDFYYFFWQFYWRAYIWQKHTILILSFLPLTNDMSFYLYCKYRMFALSALNELRGFIDSIYMENLKGENQNNGKKMNLTQQTLR